LQKGLKLGKVSSQAILKPLFAMFCSRLTVLISGFTHNPAFLAVSKFKMAGSAELVRLVDLAETDQSHRIFTTGHPVFFLIS